MRGWDHEAVDTDLADRYGTHRPRQRIVLLVVVVVLAVLGLGWLAWAGWFHSTPAISSEMGTFETVDAHTVRTVVSVDMDDVSGANCRVRALAEDHVTVGELNFTPTDGRNEVTIRTTREASSVELVGCTAEGQARPQ